MSAKGYLSIRGVPVPKDKQLDDYREYRKLLEEYFKKHKLCPECEGYGYLTSEEVSILDTAKSISIKYEGIKELEEIKETEGIHLGSKVRQIIEEMLWNRKPCTTCHGSGFVKKK